MAKVCLPADSRVYAELAFREKAKLRHRRARMSFSRKLEVLDQMREWAREIAKFSRT